MASALSNKSVEPEPDLLLQEPQFSYGDLHVHMSYGKYMSLYYMYLHGVYSLGSRPSQYAKLLCALIVRGRETIEIGEGLG